MQDGTKRGIMRFIMVAIVVNVTMVSLSYAINVALNPVQYLGPHSEPPPYEQDITDQYNLTIGVINNISYTPVYVVSSDRVYGDFSRDANALRMAEQLDLTDVTGSTYPDAEIFPPYSYSNSTTEDPNTSFNWITITYLANITLVNTSYSLAVEQPPTTYSGTYILVNGTWITLEPDSSPVELSISWWVDVFFIYRPRIGGHYTWLSIGLDACEVPCLVQKSSVWIY